MPGGNPSSDWSSAALPVSSPSDSVRAYGKYYLVRKLAEGGMAEIFLAKQVGAEGFERNVVIKRMLQHLTQVPDFVGMFVDEARLAARLAHQNIIQISDLGLEDGCYYICMEYLPGEDFSTVIRSAGRKRQYVPMAVVLKVIIEAAHGLHFAHEFTDASGKSLNIVHRDISPSNIYVSYQGQVKLLDFGIAKAESRVTNTTAGVVKGKYMYMSPEQARGLAVDRRADIFSLGVCLYEALTNRRPFARDNDLAILSAVLNNEFKLPRMERPDLPAELEAIVLKAMAGKVEDRYQTAEELASALDGFLASSTSASGGAQVSAYMHTLFGAEHVASKARILPLNALLQQSGIMVPGFNTDTKTQLADPERMAARHPSVENMPTVVAAPGSIEPRKSGSRLGWLAIGLLLGLTSFSGAYAFFKFQQQQAAVARPPVEAVAGLPLTPPPPAATTRPAEPVAAPPAEQPQAEAPPVEEAPEPARTTGRPQPAKPIMLGADDIQRVVRAGSSSIKRCFDSYKEDLPTDDGKVAVSFTIVSSGKVSRVDVLGGLGGTKVGKCLEERVGKLRFPTHKDKEVTLGLPFEYHVRRTD